MTQDQRPVGELFARVYIERRAPLGDCPFFRNRLEAYIQAKHYKDYADLSTFLMQEAGFKVSTSYHAKYATVYYDFPEFFAKSPIESVLSAITLIWRYLRNKYPAWDNKKLWTYPSADAWHQFVERAFREQNMAFTLDNMCGVHFFVDEEFERNRVSSLSCLQAARYAGVRAAFEASHKYLDVDATDTKASVRSAFEAIEILARLIAPQSNNLNKWMVVNKLKPLALEAAHDEVENNSISKAFDGLSELVDGLHYYRHGQGTTEPVEPSLTFATYVLSTTASVLRWLAEIDSRRQS